MCDWSVEKVYNLALELAAEVRKESTRFCLGVSDNVLVLLDKSFIRLLKRLKMDNRTVDEYLHDLYLAIGECRGIMTLLPRQNSACSYVLQQLFLLKNSISKQIRTIQSFLACVNVLSPFPIAILSVYAVGNRPIQNTVSKYYQLVATE